MMQLLEVVKDGVPSRAAPAGSSAASTGFEPGPPFLCQLAD